MPEIVGIRAAAAALDLQASTVSRYLARYPELKIGRGRGAKVDLEVLRRHRAENVNGLKAANHSGLPAEAPVVEDGPAVGPPAGPELPAESGYSRARTAREAIAARRAQLDLEERLGRALPKDEVEAAAYEVGQMFRERLMARNRNLGEVFATMENARQITAYLREQDLQLLADIGEALRRLAAEEEGDSHAAA